MHIQSKQNFGCATVTSQAMELRTTAHRLFQQSRAAEARLASREAAKTFLGIGFREHAANDFVSVAEQRQHFQMKE